ncbi:MAG: MtrB/PioB family decaheme-associated outer membrane protein [Arenicellales bacterium]
MKVRNLLIASGTCAVLLAPGVGVAQDSGGFTLGAAPVKKAEPIYDSSIEAGIGYNDEDSAKFGEYTGLNESGAFGILNFDILKREPWDSGNTDYYRIRGTNLGLDSRDFNAEYGDQGHYKVGVEYKEIPHNLIQDARTPYIGIGGTTLTLPANWKAAPTTQGFGTLAQALHNVDIGTKRKKLTGTFSYLPGNRWSFDLAATHKERDGTKPIFAGFGTNGGNPSAVALARPDDFTVNDIDATADYVADDLQMEFKYHGSFFNDNNNVLNFQNPYSMQASGGPWAKAAGYPAYGGYSLAPDNQAHEFTFSGGYDMGETSRLSGQLSYSMLRQNDQFLPYSTNPALTLTQGLPRQSLDGKLDILVADLAYVTQLQPRTHLRAHLRYEDQDNSTPQDIYVRIVGDAQNQPGGIANDNARINLPYSYKKALFDTEVEHRLGMRTNLGLEYKFERNSRTYSEVSRTDEHTIRAKLRRTFSESMRGRLSYTHAERNGNDSYQGNVPYLAGHTLEFLNTVAPDEQFQNNPDIRKYYEADRSLDQIKGTLNLSSTAMTSWTVTGWFQNESFHDSTLGLTDRQMLRASLDWSHTMNDNVMAHAFYAYEQFDDTMRSLSFRPGTSLTDPASAWARDATDRVHSLGAGLTWNAIRDKLDIDVDYTASLASTDFSFSGGSALQPVTDAPTLKSTLHSIDVKGDWKLKKGRRLRIGYTFEYFNSDDFTVDGIDVNSVPRVLTFGASAPHYTANVIGVSYIAQW